MPAKGSSKELNRIWIRTEQLARSLYRRRKERCFMTEDVMRLHWERQGARARRWAVQTIYVLRKNGIVRNLTREEYPPHFPGEYRRNRVWYSFCEHKLKEWGLDK